MSKGNLYTHIVRRTDARIETLSKLKHEWKKRPRDYRKIRQLEKTLKRLKNKERKEKLTDEKKYGIFAWKAKELQKQNKGTT